MDVTTEKHCEKHRSLPKRTEFKNSKVSTSAVDRALLPQISETPSPESQQGNIQCRPEREEKLPCPAYFGSKQFSTKASLPKSGW